MSLVVFGVSDLTIGQLLRGTCSGPSPAPRRTREWGGAPGHSWPVGLFSGVTKLTVH